MKTSRVCILGGTGFIGRHLAARLASAGIHCRIPSRHPQRHRELQVAGRVELMAVNPFEPAELESALEGCDAAVNLVGILNEGGPGSSFERIHVELSDRLVDACRNSGVGRLLHMSALNANETNGPSRYLKTKGEAESRVHTLGGAQIQVTSFRPSVVFGPDDSFFNRFAGLLQSLPGPFPLACPEARFAPVYVGDVVEAMRRTLDDPQSRGKRYTLCGPRQFTLKQLVDYTAGQLGLKKTVIGLGDGASRLQARLLGMLPGRPFSHDNYLSLQVDSVCEENGLATLGILPTDIDAVVPLYLGQRAQRRRYQQLRRRV